MIKLHHNYKSIRDGRSEAFKVIKSFNDPQKGTFHDDIPMWNLMLNAFSLTFSYSSKIKLSQCLTRFEPKLAFIDVTFPKWPFFLSAMIDGRSYGERHKMSNVLSRNLCVSIYEILFSISMLMRKLRLIEFDELCPVGIAQLSGALACTPAKGKKSMGGH